MNDIRNQRYPTVCGYDGYAQIVCCPGGGGGTPVSPTRAPAAVTPMTVTGSISAISKSVRDAIEV